MRTPNFKVQLTNAFFATINQIFGGSSQLTTTAKRAVIKSLSTVQTTKQCSAVVVSWEEPPNIWLTVAKNAIVGWPLNFRVRMLLKSAVKHTFLFFVLFGFVSFLLLSFVDVILHSFQPSTICFIVREGSLVYCSMAFLFFNSSP